MHNNLKWIEHNNKKIIYMDINNLETEDCLMVMDKYMSELASYAGKKVRCLIYMPNFKTSLKIGEKGKEVMKFLDEKNIDTVTALIGINSWQKSMANLIKGDRKFEFFDTMEEAKDWLAEQ